MSDEMASNGRTQTQSLILRILSELDDGLYTMQLVKLIYLVDYFYFCHEGRTATGLTYIWDEYGPNAADHRIVKEAAVLADDDVIDIRPAPGGDQARSHHLTRPVKPQFDGTLEAIVQDVVRKYGSLPIRELVALSKETAPFLHARPGKPLVMRKTAREVPAVTNDDWERHLRERAAGGGKSVAEIRAKYELD
jgi:uncharacterized phage-associated protein